MNRTIHLSAPASAALVSALIQYGIFYRGLAAKETDAALAAGHESAANGADALLPLARVTGAHELDKLAAGTLDRVVRMGSASLQRVIGNRALSPAIREVAKFEMTFLDEIHRELRPDLQHAPRAPC